MRTFKAIRGTDIFLDEGFLLLCSLWILHSNAKYLIDFRFSQVKFLSDDMLDSLFKIEGLIIINPVFRIQKVEKVRSRVICKLMNR